MNRPDIRRRTCQPPIRPANRRPRNPGVSDAAAPDDRSAEQRQDELEIARWEDDGGFCDTTPEA